MNPDLVTTEIEMGNESTELNVKLYPNPSDGNIKLETNRTGTYHVINELGQIVRTIVITDVTNVENIEGLSAGMYTVISNQAEGFVRQKIVVTK